MKYLSTHAESERKLRKCKLALNVGGISNEVKLYDWSTVQDLKQEISKALGVQVSNQRVFYGHIELTNSKMIDDYNILALHTGSKSLHVLLDHDLESYIRACSTCPPDLFCLIEQIQKGFDLNHTPSLAHDGTGGTYFMKNASNQVSAVFKPTDEEPLAPMNPKNYIGKLGSIGLRKGVLSGEAAYREVAAYLLDKSHFSNVPKTVLVESQHNVFYYPHNSLYPKTGSLQEFVKNIGTVDDFSTSIFSTQEIQKICILDIKILNMDRNESNILVVRNEGNYSLVPIDHGLSIPDSFEISDYDLCWMNWPQAKEAIVPECLEYIESMDPLSYISALQETMPFRDICLRNIRIAALLIKKGAKAGLSLYNIGSMLYRKGYSDTPSVIEKVIEDAYDLYKTITKNLNSRLKLEKYLAENSKNCYKMRSRAHSTNEIDFEPVFAQSLNSTSDSFHYKVVTISEVSESDDFEEEFQGDIFDLPDEDLPSNPNLSFSSVSLPSLDDSVIRGVKNESDAFNTKLFYYIEAFLDVAIQKKVKEMMKFSSPGGRTRSCSNIFNSY